MGFLYLIPGIASVVFGVLLWRNGLVGHPRLVGACCLTGLVLQFSGSRYVGVWLAGLLVNVGIALYLSIRLKRLEPTWLPS